MRNMRSANDNREELIELIETFVQGDASSAQVAALESRLAEDAEARRVYLRYLNMHSSLARRFSYRDDGPATAENAPPRARLPRSLWTPTWWFAGILVGVVLVAVMVTTREYLTSPESRSIARIVAAQGTFQFIGDGGIVRDDVIVGESLPDGTLEGLSPDTWIELEFTDGSRVHITGVSSVTFNDAGHKRLHLRQGAMRCEAKPQPAERPMRVFTRSAQLDVLGTRFEVATEAVLTMVRVDEGKVRVRRLPDGADVEVPARHCVIAGPYRDLTPVPVADAVPYWTSDLESGVGYTRGEWVPGTETRAPALRATAPSENSGMYGVSFRLARPAEPLVVLKPGCRLVVQGRMAEAADLVVGMTLWNKDNRFAGNFQIRFPATQFQSGEPFSLALPVEGFALVPNLRSQAEEFPATPVGSIVQSIWIHTLKVPAGLEVTHVRIEGPLESPEVQTGSAVTPPIDVWTAASTGDLKTLEEHARCGTPLDAVLQGQGVPGAGATPLHLAVLCNRPEVARFLISRGVDLNRHAADSFGGTPLHWAAALGRLELVRLLLEAGADVNALDYRKATPLDAANSHPGLSGKTRTAIRELIRAHGGRSAKQASQSPPAALDADAPAA
ncbi:hypothetical protein JCM19992_34570 [Thermostilla marina]